MKICAIIPILKERTFEEITYRELKAAARPDVDITVVSLEKGPASIESAYEEEVAAPWILQRVREAEKNGFDAVIIDCMGDPALEAAREVVDIPVVGPCQSSMMVASVLGDRFSVVTVLRRLTPLFWRMVREYGVEEKIASVRSVEVPVLELEERRDEVKAALLRESKKAIEEDGADVIILGCTGMVGMARELQESLGVPVVDPGIVPLKLAEMLVDLKLSQSKVVYPMPPQKEIRL